MDLLESLILCLDDEAADRLHAFIQTQRRSEREAVLLRLMREHPAERPKTLAAKLYQPVNLNAYYSLKKRLLNKTINYVAAQRIHTDSASPDALVALVLVARWLIDHNQPAAALFFLKKAEAEATALKRYEPVERFVSRVYRRLVQTQAFTPAQADVQAQFLYMQTHALYRIRSFARCLKIACNAIMRASNNATSLTCASIWRCTISMPPITARPTGCSVKSTTLMRAISGAVPTALGFHARLRIHGLKPVATNRIVPKVTVACYTLLPPTLSVAPEFEMG
jgi:hypothetical protein